MKKIIVVLAVFIIAFGGVYYFLGEDLTPEEEIILGVQNLFRAESMTVTGELDGEFEDQATGERFGVNLSAVSDLMLPEAFQADLDGSVAMEGMQFMGSGSVIYVENNLYGKVEEMPQIPFMPMGDEFVGQYIILEEDIDWKREMDQELDETFEETDIDPETFKEIAMESFEKSWELNVLEITETVSDEVSGRSTRKHTVAINLENLPQLVEEMVREYQELITYDEEELEEAIEEMEEEIAEYREEIDEDALEFQVWTDGEYILKVEFEFDGTVEETETSFTFSLEFENFGQDLEITAPENYITEEELQEMMMPSIEAPGMEMEELQMY